MTQAVCFHCGEMKWGAFNGCDKCGSTPQSDDELMLSMMLTDHNLSANQLDYYGRSIKSGRPPRIPESERLKLRPALEEAKVLLGMKRSTQQASSALHRGRPMPKRPKAISALATFFSKFFQSKKPTSSASIKELSKLAEPGAKAITLQLVLAGKSPKEAMSDPWALGYCFGAFEGLRLHGGFNQDDGFGLITLGFVLVLGREEAPQHIGRALALQTDEKFSEGADIGMSDMSDWLGAANSNPLALMNYFSFGRPRRR